MNNYYLISLLITAIFWGVSFCLVKKHITENPNQNILEMLLILLSGYVLLFLIIISILYKHQDLNIKKYINTSKKIILAGILFALGNIFLLYSLKYGKNTPSIKILGYSLEILIVLLISLFYLNEKISFMNYLGILIAFIGLFIITYFK